MRRSVNVGLSGGRGRECWFNQIRRGASTSMGRATRGARTSSSLSSHFISFFPLFRIPALAGGSRSHLRPIMIRRFNL